VDSQKVINNSRYCIQSSNKYFRKSGKVCTYASCTSSLSSCALINPMLPKEWNDPRDMRDTFQLIVDDQLRDELNEAEHVDCLSECCHDERIPSAMCPVSISGRCGLRLETNSYRTTWDKLISRMRTVSVGRLTRVHCVAC